MLLAKWIWGMLFFFFFFFFSLQMFELGLTPIAVILRKDMELAEEFLKSLPADFPRGPLEDLHLSLQSLRSAFSSLSTASSERMTHITWAINSETVGTRPSDTQL